VSTTRIAITDTRCDHCQRVSTDATCARCRDMLDTLQGTGLDVGVWVAIKGETGVFRITTFGRDGSLGLYGGDASEHGRRGSRSVMPDRLRIVGAPITKETEA
jgi:hypothetical protein